MLFAKYIKNIYILAIFVLFLCGNTAYASITVNDNNVHVDRGKVYNHLSYLTATGGTAPYTFTIASFLSGYVLNSDGTISGQYCGSNGSKSFSATAKDSLNATGTNSVGLIVNASPTACGVTVSGSPPSGTAGTAYSTTFTASGGTSPYTFSVTSGTLPPGLNLSSSGVLSGTPTASGSYTFTILAIDSSSTTKNGSAVFTISVSGISMTSVASSSKQVGVAYSQTNVASGATAPYTYSVTSGSLPSGTSLNTSTGTVSGTPTTSGTFNYTIQATASAFAATTNSNINGTITTSAPISITSTPSSSTQVGVAYLQTNTAIGGSGTYTYSLLSGSLPAGTTLDTSTGTVSGTPTTSGAISYTIRVTDSLSATADGASSGTIAAASVTLSLTATASSTTQVGVAYSQTNVASGGSGTYTYSLLSGSLPAGTSLDTSSGTVSGTPTTSGSFSYTIRVTDSVANVASASSSGTIASALNITSTPSTVAQVGVAYSQTNAASGGTSPYTYSVSAGTLPAGLTLNTSTGTVSGTPTTSGAFSYTIRATDNVSATADGASSGTIASVLSITSTPSSATQVGVAYSQTNTASGGTSPYTYSVSAGTLPAGLTLNTSTGTVSGTPTTSGAFSYTIRATDHVIATADGASSGTIGSALSITSTPSASTQVGVAYSQTNTASGGTSPYTYSVSAGTLPAGLTLNTSTGTVSGTPTTSGAFSYTIRVTDSASATSNGASSGTISPATLTITSTPSASTQVGVAYSQTNTASGGTSPYTYSVSAGTLPAGLTLNTSTGTVSGTPTTSGAFSYTIRVTDNASATANGASSGTISPATLTITSTPSASTQVGVAYSQTNTASGGTSPYTYSVSAGTLPTGLTLNTSTGTVSGTPTTSGAFSYTIRVTDSASATADSAYSGTMAAASTLTMTSTPSVVVQIGQFYSQANVASGGIPPYVYSVESGTLPSGTSLNTATGTVSGILTATPSGSLAKSITALEFTYTIKATDSSGGTAQNTIDPTVKPEYYNPSEDPSVIEMISAQKFSAEQLTRVQISNVWNHLQDFHDNFGVLKNNKNCQLEGFITDLTQGQLSLNKINKCRDSLPDFWMAGTISHSSVKEPFSSSTSLLTTSGVTFGLDFILNPDWMAGFALGYGTNTTEIDSLGSANNTKNYSGSGYATYQPFDKWFLDAILGYSSLTNTNQRWSTEDLIFLNGNRNANVVYGSLSLDNQIQVKQLKLNAYIREDVISATLDSYIESGNSGALGYNSLTFNTQLLSTGLFFTHDFYFGAGKKLAPFGRLEYTHTSGPTVVQRAYYAAPGESSVNYNINIGVIPNNTGLVGMGFNFETYIMNVEVSWLYSFGANSYRSSEFNAQAIIPL